MKPFIFTARNGVHIIDLEKTQAKLEEAAAFLQEIVGAGGAVLFVGTKKQGQPLIKAAAESCGMPYVTERWLGGTFTNFANIHRLIKKYLNLKEQQSTGELAKYTKKEQSEFNKEIKKLEQSLSGLTSLNKLPSAVFVLDLKKDKTALQEARKKNIPVIAICDTNVNPELVNYPIPGNDDATKSIALLVNYLAAVIKETIESMAKQPKEVKEKEAKETKEVKVKAKAKTKEEAGQE